MDADGWSHIPQVSAIRLIHTYHAVSLRVQIVSFPFDLHSAAVFHSPMPFWKQLLKATARRGICELISAVVRRHDGDLPGSASSGHHAEFHEGCHQYLKLKDTWPSVKPSNVCHGRGEADYFGVGTWVLYNLQHKGYDNNLVKNNIWRFLISSFRRVLYVVCFLLGNYPASRFFVHSTRYSLQWKWKKVTFHSWTLTSTEKRTAL